LVIEARLKMASSGIGSPVDAREALVREAGFLGRPRYT
jgi:hypothetical protein